MLSRLYRYKGTVIKVVDADTVDIKIDLGFKIYTVLRFRLARIDAWEVKGDERIKGLEAKRYVEDKILDQEVYVESKKTGKYGRWIAEIFTLDEEGKMTNLSDELVDRGHAKPVDW